MIEWLGTNGDDRMIGSGDDDVFRPLLGSDYVQGGSGYNRLIVDYDVDTLGGFSLIDYALEGFRGYISNGEQNRLSFEWIHALDVGFGSGPQSFALATTKPITGVALDVDGGAGEDTLKLTISGMALRFSVGADAFATANFNARFTGFERYAIDAGPGSHTISTGADNDAVSVDLGGSRISTGDGIDVIKTIGGADRIDGGAGSDDRWWLDTRASNTSVVLTRNGLNGKTSAGAAGSAVGVEWFEGSLGVGNDRVRLIADSRSKIFGGAGDDLFVVKVADGSYIRGGEGYDTVRFDWSSQADPITGSGIWLNQAGEMFGSIAPFASSDERAGLWGRFSAALQFDGFERVNGTLTRGDDTFAFSPFGLAAGSVVNIDGGAGQDTLSIGFADLPSVAITVRGSVLKIGSARFTGFETFVLSGSLGIGDDRLTGGTGTEILHAGLGKDLLTGGAGADQFVFDHAGSFGSYTIVRDFVSGTDTLALNSDYFDALATLPTGSVLPETAFHLGKQAESAENRLVYNELSGRLYYDADGAGGEDQVLIGIFLNKAVLSYTDIFVV